MRPNNGLWFVYAKEKAGRENEFTVMVILTSLTKIMESILKKPIEEHVACLNLEVCVDDRNGEEVDVPSICLHLKP